MNDNSTKPLQTKMIAYWRNKLELQTMSFMVISPFLNRYPVLVTTKRSLATITALWVVGILEGVTPNLIKEITGKEGHALLELAYGCPSKQPYSTGSSHTTHNASLPYSLGNSYLGAQRYHASFTCVDFHDLL